MAGQLGIDLSTAEAAAAIQVGAAAGHSRVPASAVAYEGGQIWLNSCGSGKATSREHNTLARVPPRTRDTHSAHAHKKQAMDRNSDGLLVSGGSLSPTNTQTHTYPLKQRVAHTHTRLLLAGHGQEQRRPDRVFGVGGLVGRPQGRQAVSQITRRRSCAMSEGARCERTRQGVSEGAMLWATAPRRESDHAAWP